MKKSMIIVITLIGCLTIISNSLYAAPLENDYHDRVGFFAGIGMGLGGTSFAGNTNSKTKFGIVSDVKLGYGILENVLIMYNGTFNYAKMDGFDFLIYTFPIAVQVYPLKAHAWYVRPSVGICMSTISRMEQGVERSVDTNISYSFGIASGYEFRFRKYFAISPEAVYRYSHLRKFGIRNSGHSYGVQASIIVHF